MTKPTLLFYSDCPTFGGSEKALFDLLESDTFHGQFRVIFVYRKSKQYSVAVRAHLNTKIERVPLVIWTHDSLLPWLQTIGPQNFVMRVVRRMLALSSQNLLYRNRNRRKLKRLFKDLSPRVLHVNNGGWPGALSAHDAVLAAHSLGIPSILAVHNLLDRRYVQAASLERHLTFLSKVKAIVVPSQAVVTSFSQVGINLEQLTQVLVIPNSAGSRFEDYHAKLNYENLNSSFRILAAGHLIKAKGFGVLLRAVAELKWQQGHKIQCVIYGDGPLRDELQELIAHLNISDSVYLAGSKYPLWNEFAEADVVVSSSVSFESFGITMVEAMCAARATIATNVGGLPEVVDHRKTGIIVEPGQVEPLVDALTDLVTKPQERKRLGHQGRDKYFNQYSYRAYVSRYMRLYSQLGFLKTVSKNDLWTEDK